MTALSDLLAAVRLLPGPEWKKAANEAEAEMNGCAHCANRAYTEARTSNEREIALWTHSAGTAVVTSGRPVYGWTAGLPYVNVEPVIEIDVFLGGREVRLLREVSVSDWDQWGEPLV